MLSFYLSDANCIIRSHLISFPYFCCLYSRPSSAGTCAYLWLKEVLNIRSFQNCTPFTAFFYLQIQEPNCRHIRNLYNAYINAPVLPCLAGAGFDYGLYKFLLCVVISRPISPLHMFSLGGFHALSALLLKAVDIFIEII